MATIDVCLLMDDSTEFWFDDQSCWLLNRIIFHEVPMSCAKVEISTNGNDWQDISGETQSIANTNQERMSYEHYSIYTDYPLIGSGRQEPLEIIVRIIYSEVDAEVYEQTRAIFESVQQRMSFYLRWSPDGGHAGDEMLTINDGTLNSFSYPAVSAASAGPIMAGFTVLASGVDTTIVAS